MMFEFISGLIPPTDHVTLPARISVRNEYGEFDEVACYPQYGPTYNMWFVQFEDCLYGSHLGMHGKTEEELKTIIKDIVNRHLLEKL